MAAGTVQITAYHIVCPKHFDSKASNSHLNANWCFLCSKGGSLICCEKCPASFHAECLGLENPPEGLYFCDSCETGRMPLYNEVIWAKMGSYRYSQL